LGVAVIGIPRFFVSENTVIGNRINGTQLAVFAKSSFAEQTTPATLLVHDTDGSVQNIAFQDLDLDADQLGGTVHWELPKKPHILQVTHYAVFLAEDELGRGRSKICNVFFSGITTTTGIMFSNFALI
jgi:hypothetical protein